MVQQCGPGNENLKDDMTSILGQKTLRNIESEPTSVFFEGFGENRHGFVGVS